MTVESEADVRGLLACGRLVRRIFERMRKAAVPGTSTAQLDQIAQAEFRKAGAQSAPMHFYNFPGATCISVNEVAAHGIPCQQRLRQGDLVNIDVSAVLDGYVADMGESFLVGTASSGKLRARERICRAVKQAVQLAIAEIKPGRPLNVIGATVQQVADRGGYGIVENLGSHGVGRNIHEEPSYIPKANPRERRTLSEGLVLTIEPFFTTGRPWVEERADGWTLATAPGELVAQCEQTVIVAADGPLVVTAAA